MISRRRIIYVHGYDPQGAEGYYGLFRSQLKRAGALWQTKFTLGDLVIESTEMASWTTSMAGPNWQVAVRYDFVRYEDVIKASMAEAILYRIARAVLWIVNDLVTGTTYRITRANFRFELHFVVMQLLLLVWLALSVAAVAVAWRVAAGAFDLHPFLAAAIAAAVGVAAFVAMRPLADRWLVTRILTHWPHLREFGRGNPSCFDRPIETGAARLRAAVDTGDADEIIVVGHSGGTPLAPCIIARALDLDPDLGRKGPKVVLLTVGSIMPAVALHPKAARMREAVRRIAVEPTVQWIDVQARKDVMNFWDFDPVAGIGVDAGPRRCNPLVWRIRFRDMLSEDLYRRLNGNFFRLHYQYIMANNLRAPYDYHMLVAGPLPVVEWAECGAAAVARFSSDATYLGAAEAARRGTAQQEGA